MIRSTSAVRTLVISLAITFLALSLPACSSKNGSAKNLDGVYHSAGGGPITLTIKDGKAIMTIGTDSQTLDYKVVGNQLTIINPKEGDAVFTINDDGTLNSQLGVLQKNPS